MKGAREETYAAIRRGLRVNGAESDRRAAVEQRLSIHPGGPMPERARRDDLVGLFRAEAERAGATATDLTGASEAPALIAQAMSDRGLPLIVRIGSDPRLAGLPWREAGVDVRTGPSDGQDACAVSWAFAGVAETGTAALVSGPDNPTTLNFLPDDHFVLLFRSDVCASLENLWMRLRATFGSGAMPATLNLVTGPSRSADIEQTMLLGAHGPRRLNILLIGEA